MAKRERQSPPPITEEMLRCLTSLLPQNGDFDQRLLEGLRIPAFGPARHHIRRGDPPTTSDFFPDRCWSITVMPSFHKWGMFAVFESRSLIRCAFVCKGDIPDKPNVDWAVVDCFFETGEWTDPVLDILCKGPLAPDPDRSLPEGNFRMSADGISYFLQVKTTEMSATIRFSNPRNSHYRSLERAACDLASRVARGIDHPQVSNFIKTWMGYVRH